MMIEWTSDKWRAAGFGLALWFLASLYFGVNLAPSRLIVETVTDASDLIQLYYSSNGRWSEPESLTSPLFHGWNRTVFTLPTLHLGAKVRLDPGQHPASYRIVSVRWARAGVEHVIPLDTIINARPGASQMSLANNQLLLKCTDNDGQLIVPTPGWGWRLASGAVPFGLPLVGLVLLFEAVRRRVSPLRMATVFLGACALLYFVTGLTLGPRLPLYDDWRYVYPGPFDLVDGGWQWLTVAGNDTYFLTNQLLDFVVLKVSNVSFFWLRTVAFALLMLQLTAQCKVVSKVAAKNATIAAVGVALGLWSLASGAYWGGTAVAYQQFLPTLFGTLILLYLTSKNGPSKSLLSYAALVLLCLASGLAYISGGLLLISLGLASVLVYIRSEHTRLASAIGRTGWILLSLGVALLLVQIVLVTHRQGSLFEHNHAVAEVYPNDRRFWIFFFALFGRALGYTGLSSLIDAALAFLILSPALLLGVEWTLMRRGNDAAESRPWWVLLALYAGIGSATYAAAVAYGRSGFASSDASVAQIVAMGKGRFHYWPIAAMLPYVWLGWADIAQRVHKGGKALYLVIATLLLMPKSLLAYAQTSTLLAVDNFARYGAHCVVANLANIDSGRPIVCESLTSAPLDIGPVLARLRARDSPLYRTLIEQGSPDRRNTSGPLIVGGRDNIFRNGFDVP